MPPRNSNHLANCEVYYSGILQTFNPPQGETAHSHHWPSMHSRAPRQSPNKLAITNREALSVVRWSSRFWLSRLQVASKSNGGYPPCGGYLPCGDYYRLNIDTAPDRYPIPQIQDFSAQRAWNSIFLKVDHIRGYHQIPIQDVDIPKTAVITPFDLYEFLRNPLIWKK